MSQKKKFKPQTLNYCTAAIADFGKLIEYGTNKLATVEDEGVIADVVSEISFMRLLQIALHESVKFIVPPNGRIFGDSTLDVHLSYDDPIWELFHLPFDIIAVEYPAARRKPRSPMSPYDVVSAPKRIALAMNVDAFRGLAAQFEGLLADYVEEYFSGLDFLDTSDAVIVWSLYWVDEANGKKRNVWGMSGGALIIATGADAATRRMGFFPIPTVLRDYGDRTEEMIESLRHDVGPELVAVTQLCAALNCENVKTYRIAPSKTRQAMTRHKRHKHHKRELFDYHVLDVKVPNTQNIYFRDGDEHHRRSPALHLRRGHIRHLPDGSTTKVRPALVGKKEYGYTDKSYRVHS